MDPVDDDERATMLSAIGLRPLSGLWVDDGHHVGAALTGPTIAVGWLDVTWPDPSMPEFVLRDPEPLGPEASHTALAAALDRVGVRRQAALRRCRFCERQFVSGHMHAIDVCQGCASTHFGVVY
jgi:hypothetical protein